MRGYPFLGGSLLEVPLISLDSTESYIDEQCFIKLLALSHFVLLSQVESTFYTRSLLNQRFLHPKTIGNCFSQTRT